MGNNIKNTLEQIKRNYQFSSDEQLAILLESLADSHFKGVTYWDYIEVETLLSLQKPKTNYKDEIIFITYHQICELYFKLITQELEKIISNDTSEDKATLWDNSLKRVSRYFSKLITSFDILKCGMEVNQFKEFRKSLLPASGFQTYQFRLIEIMLTPFENLINKEVRETLKKPISIDKHYDSIYWRRGAIDKITSKPAKVLINFNNKYDDLFRSKLKECYENNIYSIFLRANEEFKNNVKYTLIELESNILLWKIAHLRSVRKYIQSNLKGTGGTNWSEYLPVENQQIFYFPSFWKGLDVNEKLERLVSSYPEKIKKEVEELFAE